MTTPGGGGSSESNPWARPGDSETESAVTWVSPSTGAPVPPPNTAYARSQTATAVRRPPTTRPAPAPAPRRSSTLLRFAIAGGSLLVLGLVVVLVLAGTGVLKSRPDILANPFADPTPSGPPLARLCPPASGNPDPGGEEQPPVDGPRVVDRDSGISYLRLGSPWIPWDRDTWGNGTLGVRYKTGYYFITEHYPAGDYLASVLSGKVPATVGDSLSLNLECAGRQVAEDARRAYYPQPNVKEQVRDEQVVVGGRPAWVSTFHLTFQEDGLAARGEQVAIVLVDIGRPDAAVLYISIPDTHKQWDAQIDRIIASIQPA